MPRLEFFVVADSVSIDQNTNLASIFNILEEIRPQGFPILLSRCVAFSLWYRQEGDENRDFQSTLRVISPDGATREFASNFRLVRPRHRIVQGIQNLQITTPGDLRFELLLNGGHAADHIVTVGEVNVADTNENIH